MTRSSQLLLQQIQPRRSHPVQRLLIDRPSIHPPLGGDRLDFVV